jgi:hypothetical protein
MHGCRGAGACVLTTLRAVQRLDQPVDVAPGLQPPERGQRALAGLAGFVTERLDQLRIATPAGGGDLDEHGAECSGKLPGWELPAPEHVPLQSFSGKDGKTYASH